MKAADFFGVHAVIERNYSHWGLSHGSALSIDMDTDLLEESENRNDRPESPEPGNLLFSIFTLGTKGLLMKPLGRFRWLMT